MSGAYTRIFTLGVSSGVNKGGWGYLPPPRILVVITPPIFLGVITPPPNLGDANIPV